jgi:hypothetical protein
LPYQSLKFTEDMVYQMATMLYSLGDVDAQLLDFDRRIVVWLVQKSRLSGGDSNTSNIECTDSDKDCGMMKVHASFDVSCYTYDREIPSRRFATETQQLTPHLSLSIRASLLPIKRSEKMRLIRPHTLAMKMQ